MPPIQLNVNIQLNGRCTILTDAGDYGNHYENRQFKVLPIGKDNFAELRDKIVIT